jgi:hypothetical protein
MPLLGCDVLEVEEEEQEEEEEEEKEKKEEDLVLGLLGASELCSCRT